MNFGKYLLILFLFLSFSIEKKKELKNDFLESELSFKDLDFIIIGEDHTKNNSNARYLLLKKLDCDGLKVALEFPRSLQKVCNDYIQGISCDEALWRIKMYDFLNRKDQLNFLNKLKEFNSSNNNRIHVICFDIEANRGNLALKPLVSMLLYHKNSSLNKLIELCSTKVPNLEKLKFSISKIRIELLENSENYQKILQDDYQIFLDAIQGIEINNFNGVNSVSNEKLEKERESYLAQKLINEGKNDSVKILVFTGNFHVNQLDNDTIMPSNNSFSNLLKFTYRKRINSFFTLYSHCRESIIDKFYPQLIDFLNIDLSEKFKSEHANYLFFKSDALLSSPFFKNRCDGVIVKSCRRRN